ncbi:MAG: S-type Pyocin [Marinobacter excellens HL-55]|uniref:S-type Pyocin n=1 Tax=Marinobacter excellens HL-55 TaxID=1305731 RepID=A0A0P7ZA38_9GAMM|nr:MAG: S-type Pyocin [Marinobacter excellens HL-55]
MTKIADPHSLALHEALMIEGGWDQYSDRELASYLSSSSFTPSRLRDQLASGELVLLKEIPAVPVFRLVSGSIVPAESASVAIAENAVMAFERRFGDRQAFPARGTAYAHSDSLAPPARLDYTPEPPVIEPPPEPLPPPVVISENFGLPPLGPKVFAKSCTRPSGDTDSNEGQEKASNFGTLAMLAPATVTSPGANGLRPLGLISGSAMRLAKGWAMAARIGASVMSTAASTALLALWPSKLGDGTLYTEEELLEMAEAAIRVRFHLHVDATGNLRVAGYHVNDSTGYKDRVPVAHAELKGENFEVVVDDDFTLVWYPDDSGHRPVVSTEYPAYSGIDPYSVLVTPIQEDGQEHSPPGYQRPFEDQVELIVSFPKDSGIEPLYLVFQKSVGSDGEGVRNKRALDDAISGLRSATGTDANQFARQIAGMSTHVNQDSNRVVLGRWAENGGYIQEAKANGGVWYETESSFFSKLTNGLGEAEGRAKAWSVNEQFLQSQLERGVGRIDLHGETIRDVLINRPNSFTAMEIKYLESNAKNFGYCQWPFILTHLWPIKLTHLS